MCFTDNSAATKATAEANARADEALAAAQAASDLASQSLVPAADSESARAAAEDKQRKLIQAGGGLVVTPQTSAPLAYATLFGQ